MFLPWGPCKGPRRRQTSVGPKTPCWAPACITPNLPCALKKQKSHLAKQNGWRGRVGNSSMLIPNRIPGPRRSVLWRRLYFSSNGIWFGRECRKAARVNEKLYVISVTQGLSSCRFVDWGIWPQSCAPELKKKRMLSCLPFITSALPSPPGICTLLPAVS